MLHYADYSLSITHELGGFLDEKELLAIIDLIIRGKLISFPEVISAQLASSNRGFHLKLQRDSKLKIFDKVNFRHTQYAYFGAFERPMTRRRELRNPRDGGASI